jgi:hypothetical protein
MQLTRALKEQMLVGEQGHDFAWTISHHTEEEMPERLIIGFRYSYHPYIGDSQWI